MSVQTVNGPVVITGASGFIGRALTVYLSLRGVDVRAVTRGTHGDLATADVALLTQTCEGATTVFHLAGLAHRKVARGRRARALYRAANRDATERVAHAAVEAGVGTFVLASTVKVNGERTRPGQPFMARDPARPHDAYARSKLEAEDALRVIAVHAALRPVILRLPLVIGAGAKGNVRRLWDAVANHRRLPLGSIRNQRSFIGLENLCEAMVAAASAPPATYLLAEAPPLSTPDLVRAFAEAQQTTARMSRVPVALLKLGGFLTGQGDAVRSLVDSLEVDGSAFEEASGWRPRHTLAAQLARMRVAGG